MIKFPWIYKLRFVQTKSYIVAKVGSYTKGLKVCTILLTMRLQNINHLSETNTYEHCAEIKAFNSSKKWQLEGHSNEDKQGMLLMYQNWCM